MDIRTLYGSLSPEDIALYQKVRTDMRKVYLNAHTNIVHIENWDVTDDAFMDLLDIKIAILFDRAGAIEGLKSAIDKNEEKAIEKNVEAQGDKLTVKMNTEMSEGSQKLKANVAGQQW